MGIGKDELIRKYGALCLTGHAAMFIGAGLSMDSKYPSWGKLLQKLRGQAKVPPGMTDMPLVAQYITQTIPGGTDVLHAQVLRELSKASGNSPGRGHESLAKIPVDEIWTTNYDSLLEQAMPDLRLVHSDEDLLVRSHSQRRQIIKMHGSVGREAPLCWISDPVITRRDYEQYEMEHPRLWAALRSTYLTKSILFLGFSFTDPNIELLLRLARTSLSMKAPEHYTVLRRPDKDEKEELKLHRLRVIDLEASGVTVCEVDDYDELPDLLAALAQRTREPLLFVGGSKAEHSLANFANRLGEALVDLPIRVVSLAGPVAMNVSHAFGALALHEHTYKTDQVAFYYRQESGTPPPLGRRIGTANYTEFTDVEDLRDFVLSQCRAAIFLGGGDRTAAEVTAARKLGVQIIPVSSTGGEAKRLWEAVNIGTEPSTITAMDPNRQDWVSLASPDDAQAVRAAVRLVRAAMFLDDDPQSSVDQPEGGR